MVGELFVKAMMNKKSEDIEEAFKKTIQELQKLGIQEKQGNSFALLVLADVLAREFGLLPKEWEALSCERIVAWNGVKEITDPTEAMYGLLSEQVFKDVSYVPIDDEMFVSNPYGQTQEQVFKLKMKTDKEIRGRIAWQRKDINGEWQECEKEKRERSILLIPNLQLQQLFQHLKEESGLTSFGFDKKRWAQNGWLFKNGNEYTFKGKFKFGITRPYDSKSRENYYIILLKEDL